MVKKKVYSLMCAAMLVAVVAVPAMAVATADSST